MPSDARLKADMRLRIARIMGRIDSAAADSRFAAVEFDLEVALSSMRDAYERLGPSEPWDEVLAKSKTYDAHKGSTS